MRRGALLVVLLGAGCGAEAPPPAPRAFEVAVPYPHASLEPHGDGTFGLRLSTSQNVYEPLIALDTDLRAHPGLALSWSSPDERTWVFELRDAVFHSGRTLTAEDVVHSLRRAAVRSRDTSYYLIDLESVRARGPRTVEVRTKGPAPRLLNRLGLVPIVPADPGDLSRTADGTGPYAVEGWEPGRWLALRRHERWWNGRPDIARAVYHFDVPGPEAERGLLDGRFQLAQFTAGFDPALVAASPRHQLVEQEDFHVTYLAWNLRRPSPFADRRVRQALSLALSPSAIADALPRRARPAVQLVSRHVFGFDPGVMPAAHDPARARAILAEAGLAGLRATLTVRSRYRDVGELLVRQAAGVGLRLSLEDEPDQRFFERLRARELALWLDNWGCTTGDAAELFENALHSPDTHAAYGSFNETGYANPVLDRRIAAAAVLDGEERRQALQELMRTALEDLVLLPLYSDVEVYGIGRDLTWRPRVDSAIRLSDVKFAAR